MRLQSASTFTQGPHPRDQICWTKRLRHVVVCSALEGKFAIRLACARCKHDDRQCSQNAMFPYASAELKTVNAGKHQIEQKTKREVGSWLPPGHSSRFETSVWRIQPSPDEGESGALYPRRLPPTRSWAEDRRSQALTHMIMHEIVTSFRLLKEQTTRSPGVLNLKWCASFPEIPRSSRCSLKSPTI